MQRKWFFGSLIFSLLLATPGNSTNIHLGWEAPVHADGTPVANLEGYTLYSGSCPISYTDSKSLEKVLSHTIANVEKERIYFYTVAARGAGGVESPVAKPVFVVVPTVSPHLGVPIPSVRLMSVDRFVVGYEGDKALDGNPVTMWHTPWGAPVAPHPHTMVVDLQQMYEIDGFTYTPRLDMLNGTIASYTLHVSRDNITWTLVAKGLFEKTTAPKTERFAAKPGRYVRLRALSEVLGQPYTSIAELTILGAPFMNVK